MKYRVLSARSGVLVRSGQRCRGQQGTSELRGQVLDLRVPSCRASPSWSEPGHGHVPGNRQQRRRHLFRQRRRSRHVQISAEMTGLQEVRPPAISGSKSARRLTLDLELAVGALEEVADRDR